MARITGMMRSTHLFSGSGSASRDPETSGNVLPWIPISKRLLLIIWPFLAIVPVLVLLALASMEILSAGRAYVGGESLWSKAQKQSISWLTRYARTGSEVDYRKSQQALAVILGDRKARVELEKPHPDLEVARQGFLEGGNHPEDIPGMIRLFRYFRDVSYIDRAITLWARGDVEIAAVKEVADELHALIAAGDPDARKVQELLERIQVIDDRLTPLTDAFSAALGEATRKTKLILLVATMLVATILVWVGILLSRRMLRHSEAFETALRLSDERFNLAVTGSNDGLWDWNVSSGEMYYSPRYKQLLGCSDQDMENTQQALLSRLHPEDRPAAMADLDAHLSGDLPYDSEYRLKAKSGEYRWFRTRGQSVRDAQGRAVRIAGSITDITDRKLAEAQLFAEKERALVTLASIGDAVIATDTQGLVEYLNPVAEELTGWTTEQALGLPLREVFSIVDEASRQAMTDPVETVLREGRAVEIAVNILLLRRDGTEVAVDESAAPIRDRAGQIAGVVLVFHDVSRERQYAAKLSYQASHDALTGLINRREFEHRLGRALASAAQMERHHAVMYLDLDQFKVVNDTSGHAAGDEMIRQVSAILQERLREGDTLARLGGDEFGVLLENCPPEHAERIADLLRQTVVEFPFSWHTRSFTVGVSIGLVNVTDASFTLQEVLRAADAACYMAKEKGRNRVQVYHPGDTEISLRQGEMEWVGRIHKALDEGRFCLYAQEIVEVAAPATAGAHFELLIRMLDERGELVPPMAFIPAAERYNLMPLIDRWVITTAFSTLARLRAEGQAEKIETCSINLSGASIGDERFLDFIRAELAKFRVPPGTVCLEITETAAIGNLAKAAHFIHELRALGCRFSLDDFGSGMSSFAYLKHLPVDFLKIDGGFVKDMLDDPIDRAMVQAINHIGHVMGKKTIAEFVENDRILADLREIGVDFAQGYGIAKPKPFGPFRPEAQASPVGVAGHA